jgi:hypothetical protein
MTGTILDIDGGMQLGDVSRLDAMSAQQGDPRGH